MSQITTPVEAIDAAIDLIVYLQNENHELTDTNLKLENEIADYKTQDEATQASIAKLNELLAAKDAQSPAPAEPTTPVAEPTPAASSDPAPVVEPAPTSDSTPVVATPSPDPTPVIEPVAPTEPVVATDSGVVPTPVNVSATL